MALPTPLPGVQPRVAPVGSALRTGEPLMNHPRDPGPRPGSVPVVLRDVLRLRRASRAALSRRRPDALRPPGLRPRARSSGGADRARPVMHFGVMLADPSAVRALRDRLVADGVEVVEQYDEPDYISVKCRDPDDYIVDVDLLLDARRRPGRDRQGGEGGRAPAGLGRRPPGRGGRRLRPLGRGQPSGTCDDRRVT
jgi:hypothetical protein